MKEKLIHFFKQETVLCAALALAALSMFLVRPDAEYLSYIDFRTLAILFCLMGAMAGLQKTGVFQWIAQALLARVRKTRQLVWILVLLCFFSSMAVTNDVALITFVPFTFTVLDLIGPEARKRLTIPIVVLQTIAANLGSMLTPIGNPQNLYLYGKAGLSLGAFLLLMLPYACVSFLLIMLWSIVQSRAYNVPVEVSFREEIRLDRKKAQLAGYLVLFALDLLTVARVIPYGLALLLTIAGLLVLDRSIFARVDYSLLLTFVGFFVFIGNMGRLPVFYEFLQKIVSGHELLAGAAASQVISNVPAALLLSGFTENFPPLIIGVNLGGLGTLIASMASLISYKFVAREEPGMKGTYFRQFTFSNVAFLAVLLVFALVLG
ncbi:MAG: citrate transporter [Oscillibacter sp.]|jgi:Na+/H+ antiporter NhaD/arsenite permease-like protein|uniref:SLC13 family permease n=1 Tax=Oscillibacter sp. TaxID=1945593 RepID=UPI00216EFF75|nr:SLC13 family permease [Oscillibacter sp.]MCI9113561.1 citrate transporter [Oscillibacter sp.]